MVDLESMQIYVDLGRSIRTNTVKTPLCTKDLKIFLFTPKEMQDIYFPASTRRSMDVLWMFWCYVHWMF